MTTLARYGALRAELDEAGDAAGRVRLTECWEHAVAIWAYVECPGCLTVARHAAMTRTPRTLRCICSVIWTSARRAEVLSGGGRAGHTHPRPFSRGTSRT